MRLIVSDKCLGLYEIIGDFFPEAKWQRCIVHWYRNAFTMCPWKHFREVVAMLKAIHAQKDKAAARQKAALVAEKLRAMKLERIASFAETSVEETLSYMDFPYEHWSRLRTNNGLERIMKEIRRRTRVVGSFPDGWSQTQAYFHNKMGHSAVYEHLQTLRRQYKEAPPSQPTCPSGALWSVGCFGCDKSHLSSVIIQKQMCAKLRTLPF